jgi:hypothetical protein
LFTTISPIPSIVPNTENVVQEIFERTNERLIVGSGL